jgi:hypothetical protein
MYFHNVVGTGSYTTSTTNMYNKYQFHAQYTLALPQRRCVGVVEPGGHQYPGWQKATALLPHWVVVPENQ